MLIKAAVCRAPRAPMAIEEVELEDPRDDEVMVKITSCGVCHTDIAMRDRHFPIPLPVVLGHEGAGIVEKVGKTVIGLEPGDPVVVTYSSCGRCPSCYAGAPGLCHDIYKYNFICARFDGTTALKKGGETIHSHFFGQSSFATHIITRPCNILKLDSTKDMDLFGPLGCGIQTGAGAVMNALRPRPGDSLAAFGIGAVALSAIMAARVCGLTTIIAVGRNDKKLETAMEMGATHTVNSTKVDNVAHAIRDITGGAGVNFSVETSGIQELIGQAIDCLSIMGKTVILGSSAKGTQIQTDATAFLNSGKTVLGSVEGNCVPQDLLPRLIALYRQERFPLDKMIRFYPFEKINEALEDSEKGRVLKPVLKMS